VDVNKVISDAESALDESLDIGYGSLLCVAAWGGDDQWLRENDL